MMMQTARGRSAIGAQRQQHVAARRPQPALLRPRTLLVVRAAQGSADSETLRKEYVKGCKTILMELQGLDFSRKEAQLYFQLSDKLPKGAPKDFEIERARVALNAVLEEYGAGKGPADEGDYANTTSALDDLEALKVSQLMLSEVWRWRRRGGGMDDDDEYKAPHQQALLEIQNFKPEDIDRISSNLLDNLDMKEEDKRAVSGALQQVAVAGFQGAVWGSLVLTLLFLIGFNFLRSG